MERKKTASITQIEQVPIKTDPERHHGGPQSGLPPDFIVGSELAPYLIVGVDFGTGFCQVCTFTKGAPYAVQPRYFRALVEDTLGYQIDPTKLVHSLKHCISDNYCVRDRNVLYSAVDLTRKFFSNIKAQVEKSTERLLAKAVIGVPACFNHRQRQDLIAAASEAGIAVLGLINEPTAAALHAAYMKDLPNGKYLIVSNGAYSFEASIADLQNRLLEIKVIKGDRSLSGNAVTKLLAAGMQKQYDLDATDQLHIAVDRTKKEFEKNGVANIDLPGRTITLNRSDAAGYLDDYVIRVKSLISSLVSGAHLSASDIRGIILSGEATKLWRLREVLQEEFTSAKACSADISAGAAIYAALLVRQTKNWVVWDAIADPVLVAQGNRIQEVVAANSPLPINGHCNISPDSNGITEAAIFQREIEGDAELIQVAKAHITEELQSTESGATVDLSVMATPNGTLSLSARHKELDVNLTVELISFKEEPEVIDMTPAEETEALPAAASAVNKDSSTLLDPGLTLEKIADRWFVEDVVENSSAAKAGINIYDELVSIDGYPVTPVTNFGDLVREVLTTQPTSAAETVKFALGFDRGGTRFDATLECTEPCDRFQAAHLKFAIADAIIYGDDRRLVQKLLDYAGYIKSTVPENFDEATSVIKRATEKAGKSFGTEDILYVRALCDDCSVQIQLALLQSKGRDPFPALSAINEIWQRLFGILEKHPLLQPAVIKHLFDLAVQFQLLRDMGIAVDQKIEGLTKWAVAYAEDHRLAQVVRDHLLQRLNNPQSGAAQPAPTESAEKQDNPPISEETTGES
jgi:molecular chaperone DnaK (HSP70)